MRGTISRRDSKETRRRAVLRALPMLAFACVLLAAGVSFADYVSKGGGSDEARVAGGGISVTYDASPGDDADYSIGDDGSVTMEFNRPSSSESSDEVMEKSFKFWVSNIAPDGEPSEVAISYDIAVSLGTGEGLPSGVIMMIDGYNVDASGGYTLSNAGSFAAGESPAREHVLSVSVDFGTVSEDYELEGIGIAVMAKQID